MDRFVGIDVGGTNIKGIICDFSGKVLAEGSVPTESRLGGDAVCKNIVSLIERMLGSAHLDLKEVAGVGVACPGMIDGRSGTVIFAGNLYLKNFPLGEKLKGALKTEVRITNDANAAALGEAKFGAGKNYSDSLFITLGTGVGGGVIIDGKLFEGNMSAGAELGHTVIVKGGRKCTCGRRGCLEAYASATALIDMTKRAMRADKTSAMWKVCGLDGVDGRTAFSCPNDPVAKQVVEKYLSYLACGLVNFANVFRPQVIILGGGVSAQGDNIVKPVQKMLDAELFGGIKYAPVKVVCAKLSNRAGAYGAASLLM